jgi:hypothetical protein
MFIRVNFFIFNYNLQRKYKTKKNHETLKKFK